MTKASKSPGGRGGKRKGSGGGRAGDSTGKPKNSNEANRPSNAKLGQRDAATVSPL